MTLLITGAGGQVGHELAHRLDAGDHALDRAALDITDAAAVEAAVARLQPQVVINAAAYTAVDKAEHDKDRAEAVNATGPANLAQACMRHDAALLHLSTDYVFDGGKGTPYVETDTPNPRGVYATSKWHGEEAVRAALQRHVILRVSWVFGVHGNNFVKTMLRLAAERDELRVVADQHGAPTPAADIADALLRIAQHATADPTMPWGTYHYAGTPDTTWHGFATEIIDRAHAAGFLRKQIPVRSIDTSEYPTPASRPVNSRFDCSAIERAFGIPRPDWLLGLDSMIGRLPEVNA